MHDTTDNLRRTMAWVRTVMARLAFVFDQFRSAFRTVRDELERLAAGRTFGQINAGNFRNNFAALFHIDHIAEPDIEQRDLFGIVKPV